MQVVIQGKNIEVTEGIRDNIIESLHVLDKYFKSDEIEVKVVVKTYSGKQKIEITIPVDKKNIIRQEATAFDLYEAINIATKKLEAQIRKTKDIATNHINERKELLEFLESIEHKEEQSSVVKTKDIEILPMDVQEAMLQIELIGHDFYVFIDGETEETKIIYKRKAGEFGILVLK